MFLKSIKKVKVCLIYISTFISVFLITNFSFAAGDKISYPQKNGLFQVLLEPLTEPLNKEVFKFTKKFAQAVMD